MPRAKRGRGAFHVRPNGRIEHSVSLGYDAEGRRIRVKVFGATERECIALMAEKLAEIKRKGGVPVRDGAPRLGEWCLSWLARKKTALDADTIEQSTYDVYERHLRLHLVGDLAAKRGKYPPRAIAQVRIDRLTRDDGDRWLDALERDGVGGRSRQVVRATVVAALEAAVDRELIDRNVIARTDVPEHRQREFPIWEPEQARRFIEAARGERYGAFWTLFLTAGPRPHEMLGLRVDEVDLAAGTATIAEQLARGGQTRKRLKTAPSRRALYLAPVAVDALRMHRERMLAEGLRASPWLFPRPDGCASRYDVVVDQSFNAIVERAGVPRIRPYDLRHTYATLALLAGVPLHVVSRNLGHASPVFTAKQYAHALRQFQDRHVEAIQEMFGAAAG